MARKLAALGILVVGVLAILSSYASAHPGNTDSSGGHTCKTNCPSWGLGYGEYHFHGGGSPSPSFSIPTTTWRRSTTTLRSSTATTLKTNSTSSGEDETDYTIWWVLGAGAVALGIYSYVQHEE